MGAEPEGSPYRPPHADLGVRPAQPRPPSYLGTCFIGIPAFPTLLVSMTWACVAPYAPGPLPAVTIGLTWALGTVLGARAYLRLRRERR